MSHYTCLVIGEDAEEALEPYDENTATKPYKAYWDSETIEMWERRLRQKTETRKNKDGDEFTFTYPPEQVLQEGEYSLEEMRRVYLARFRGFSWADEETNDYEHDDEEPHVDDGGIYEWSTYNPKAKWDWWVVGGRWAGFFKLKKEALVGSSALGEPGTFDNEPKFDADMVLKEDIDIEWMRNEAGRVAGETWDKVNAAVGHLPEALGWEEHYIGLMKLAAAGEGEYTIEQLRDEYHAQERVVAFKEWNASLPEGEKVAGLFGPNVEDFQVSRAVLVTQARNDALCPFAYIYEGEWHAPGKMGWFGNSSDEKKDRVRFAQEFNELLDSLPGDTLLTLCDLHI